MNRSVKRIVAITLAVTAISGVAPASNLNLIGTKVYASSGDLTSIKLRTSSGDTITTYDEDDYRSKNEVDYDDMDEGETYYAKTSSDKIKISISGVSSSHVRIFKGKSSSTRGLRTISTIDLSPGSTTTLTVRTYSDDPGTIKYSDNSYVSEYTIKVKCTANSSSTDAVENGDVYLRSLYLSDGDFNFSKNTSLYNINVIESVSEVKITAKPDCDSDEYDDYEVKIDGTTVDEDDKFRKTVSLNKGKNEIKITVEDDNDEKRTYTLNITRGSVDTTTTTNNGTSTDVKMNQWVMVNGRWQYNDSLGIAIKNNWFYDKNYGKSYFLQADGNMATGWLSYGGNLYYLGSDGSKKMGWQSVNGSWYYLDFEGKMKTGWIRDIDGRYYYLYSNGAMAYSTTINGYKVGNNGAWIR